MPSSNIHLAVAIKYCEKNKIEDEKSFFEGAVYPDLVEHKEVIHYTKPRDKDNLKEYLQRKTDLKAYLDNNEINTDFNKGVFLHLITDDIFFKEFFDTQYIDRVKFPEFINALYYSYTITNPYLEEKYGINNKKIGKELMEKIKYIPSEERIAENILPFEKLDKFIDLISDINLEEYANKIKGLNK